MTPEKVREIFREELMAHDEAVRKAEQVPLCEVLVRLHKSKATLWRWHKSGYLPRHKRGGNVWYWEKDVARVEHNSN